MFALSLITLSLILKTSRLSVLKRNKHYLANMAFPEEIWIGLL